MEIIADLHIHGRFSRATSKQLTIENLEKYAKIKGVDLMGTGDFTHPEWIKELKTNLTNDGNGIFKTKSGFPFVLQTELSLIYTDLGRGRKVHNVVLAPDFEVVDQITEYLLTKGRIDYDGRPIFKIPCHEFVESLRKISEKIEVIPAHCWTPHFGVFGSESGYDKIEDAFKDQTKHIHALETGLSSNPLMNWRLSALDRFSLVSFSDLHSFWPWRLGREATLLSIDLSYDNILKALRTKEGLNGTIEVDPSYGKYHFDGHRNCKVCMNPKQSIQNNKICPKCGRPLTIGVLHRVEELADREEGFRPEGAKPFHTLIPLSDILSAVLKKAVATQAVWKEYNKIVADGRSEYDILLRLSEEELKKITDEKIAEYIIKNRAGKIAVSPGFDGEYGVPQIGEVKAEVEEATEIKGAKQTGLSDFS